MQLIGFAKFFLTGNLPGNFLLANCLQIKKELQTFVCNPLIFSVGIPGFEPGTPCSQSRCATGLRYIPKKSDWLTGVWLNGLNSSTNHQSTNHQKKADRPGFEPGVRFTPYVGLANRWFQPLTHLSERDAKVRRPYPYRQINFPTFF